MKLISFSTLAASLIFLMSVNGVVVEKNDNPLSPKFSIENNFGTCSSMGGSDNKYLLLQFWASTDAASRIKNKQWSGLAKECDNNLKYAGVYMGKDKTLFDAAIASDGCDSAEQYFVNDKEKADNLYADFSLSTGNHTFLIAPNGRIVAVNPTAEEIKSKILI